jgi:hypothetical protein
LITYKIIKAKNYAYAEIRGQPVLGEFVAASLKFIADPDYTPDMHRLCDFSQADLEHISVDHFLEYVEFAKKNVSLNPGARVALVAPDKYHSTIYRSFSAHANSGVFQVFLDPAAAVEWIKCAAIQTASEGNQQEERLNILG